MNIGPEDVGNGSTTMQERFPHPGGYQPARRDSEPPEHEPLPRNGSAPEQAPSLALGDLSEPVYPPASWLEHHETGSLVDHPLLRGLLMELPPKGSVPPPGWLDRWFEAARSILELLYVQGSGRNR
ncbi:hypothetical protein [Phytohabitans aurantiacus]|uniref:Uncharacterized protein n=1 Tax=Phytohabitans aurantiacus TaxID=3016789 RepID=A0ABQ5QT56_9ACTN|nr:hypothetical protein [Phytohabitans aurantiacus]GLH97683.1 hypothetical protein Pa4123_29580 [Phytohabitans aurantiacus]